MEFVELLIDDVFEDVDQAADFIRRALPVFGRESVDGQVLDAEFDTGLQDAPQVVHPGTVTC